jgi:hypothetical protein
MWEHWHLISLWASTACYRDSFTFLYCRGEKLISRIWRIHIFSEHLNKKAWFLECRLYTFTYVFMYIVTWLIIMGSGFDDRFYWNFFTITTNYNWSQLMTVHDSLYSLLDYECLLFHQRPITAHRLNCLERRLSDESLWKISHLLEFANELSFTIARWPK